MGRPFHFQKACFEKTQAPVFRALSLQTLGDREKTQALVFQLPSLRSLGDRVAALGVCWLLLGLGGAWPLAVASVPIRMARFPAPSPDGKTLAFGWRGDIWLSDLQGGLARRWTAHPADDRHPVWSPDGRSLAWASRRHGNYDVYVASASGGEPRRLTWHQTDDIPLFWSQDSRFVIFRTSRDSGAFYKDTLYQVAREGGQPTLFLDTIANEAALSPDGKRLALVRGDRRAWRKRYTMPYHRSIWLFDLASRSFQQLTPPKVSADSPSWLDPQTLVFRSEASGIFNLWKADLSHAKVALSPLTTYKGEGIRSPKADLQGNVVFALWDRLYLWRDASKSPDAGKLKSPDASKPKSSHPQEPKFRVQGVQEIALQGLGDQATEPIRRKVVSKPIQQYALSPDGQEVAAVLFGDIVVRLLDDPDPLGVTLGSSPAREGEPAWSPDGRLLAFTSAKDGTSALYIAQAGEKEGKPLRLSKTRRPVIKRFSPPMLAAPETSPAFAPDGRSIAFLRDAKALVIRSLDQKTETTVLAGWNLQSFRWSGDGRWFLLTRLDDVSNEDVFLLPSDGRTAPINLSRHPDTDTQPVWSKNGKVIAFLSRGIDQRFFLHTLLPDLSDDEADAFDLQRRRKEWIKAWKTQSKAPPPRSLPSEAKPSSPAGDAKPPKPRPKRKRPSLKKPLAPNEGTPKNAGAKANKGSSKNGKNETSKGPASKAAFIPPFQRGKAFQVDTADLHLRLRRITDLPGATGPERIELSPDGSEILFTIRGQGRGKAGAGLYRIKSDGKGQKLVLPGEIRHARFDAKGDIFFLSKDGVLHHLPAKAAKPKPIALTAELIDDQAAIQKAAFLEGWSLLQRWFYDPAFHGADWKGLRDRYLGLLGSIATREDFEDAIHWLLGELSASHLGIISPPPKERMETADLGVTFDPTYKGPGYRIAQVRPKGPASRKASLLRQGEILLSIEGQALSSSTNLAQILAFRAGRESLLQIQDTQGKPREILLRPVSQGQAATERYKAWVEDNRREVDRLSKGRLGYAHIRSMGLPSLDQFERDLFAHAWGKEGLVLDIRNNGGGWTADFVLSMFRPFPHATTQWRGSGRGYPAQRRTFYSWHRPVVLLINERSISNAEILAHAFRNLRIGRVIGMPTYGGVISTGGERLVDGSFFRVPLRGWWTIPGGQNMENGPASPDILVPLSPSDEMNSRDPQLQRAIQELLPAPTPKASPETPTPSKERKEKAP